MSTRNFIQKTFSPGAVASEESCQILAEWMQLISHYQSLGDQLVLRDNQILEVIDEIEQTRLKWKDAEVKGEKSRSKLAAVERENANLRAETDKVREEFRKSEERAASLLTRLQALQSENNEYRRRQDSARNILKENCGNFGQISKLMPLLTSDEEENLSRAVSPPSSLEHDSSSAQNTNMGIDYDQTGDSFMGQMDDCEKVELRGGRTYMRRSNAHNVSGKRRSVSQQAPKKRSAFAVAQLAHIDEVEAFEEEEKEDEVEPYENSGPTPPKRSRGVKREVKISSATRRFRRSVSESNVLAEAEKATPMRTPRRITTSRADINGWTRGLPIEECDHKFVSSSAFFMGHCCSCFTSLGFRALRCEHCKLCVHDKCVANAPMPCIPSIKVPPKQKQRLRLLDYCPDSQPKIPALIIRCVFALESRYLNAVGIYRLSANEKEAKALLESFNSNYVPNLNSRDHETITSCMKKFLIGLREPLLPTSSYNEFANAAESGDSGELMHLVTELPIPNRDTLAYLCAHWQKIASNCNVNQMPIENIAKCLGPTVVGSSLTKAPSARLVDHKLLEAESQIRVLLQLLRLDTNFWRSFFDPPTGDTHHTPHMQQQLIVTPKTAPPIAMRVREFKADQTFLGPVSKSPSKGLLLQPITRTPGRPPFSRRC